MSRIVFIGPMGGGEVPTNGASLKNYHLLNRLSELGCSLIPVDTEKWRRNPFVLLKLFYVVLLHPHSHFVVSANNTSTYRLLSLICLLPPHKDIIYWVIGGSIADWIKEGKVSRKPYEKLRLFIVEGDSMKRTLSDCGFNNVLTLPNFKRIGYIPSKQYVNKTVKFVFLSRIVEQKGCDIIIEATKILNKKIKDKFLVDFYGSIGDEYREFNNKIEHISNISYKGFLDLRNPDNYDILASYDVMLFPTFWHGEGFPGIMIDAFISGLPVIATDWHMNKDILQEAVTGLFVRPNNVEDLVDAMEKVINNRSVIEVMSKNCQKEAMKYNTESVVNAGLIKKIFK